MKHSQQSPGQRFLLLLSFTAALAFGSTASAGKAPVQVYILSGQSNMVGIGQIDGGGSR